MFGPAGNYNFIRILGGELNCITNFITPQSTVSTNYHGIVFSYFYLIKWNGQRIFVMVTVHRYKLVINTIIEHQQHILFIWFILNGKKPFRSIICLHVVHIFLWNKFLVLLSVWIKFDPAMCENLNIRPNFEYIFLAGFFKYPFQQNQIPRWYSGKTCDIFSN